MQVFQQSSCVGTTQEQQRYYKGAVLLVLGRYKSVYPLRLYDTKLAQHFEKLAQQILFE